MVTTEDYKKIYETAKQLADEDTKRYDPLSNVMGNMPEQEQNKKRKMYFETQLIYHIQNMVQLMSV